MDKRYELDQVKLLSVYTMGEPGKRTFFLIIGQKEDWIRVWLEKEQLEALGLAVDQFLFTLSREHPDLPRNEDETSLSDHVPSRMPSAELEIDQIVLGFEGEWAALDFLAHVVGPQSEETAQLTCRAALAQLKEMGSQAKSVCAAGRPRCVLCGRPIDLEGHTCPSDN